VIKNVDSAKHYYGYSSQPDRRWPQGEIVIIGRIVVMGYAMTVAPGLTLELSVVSPLNIQTRLQFLDYLGVTQHHNLVALVEVNHTTSNANLHAAVWTA
jgi:hypothetical protein